MQLACLCREVGVSSCETQLYCTYRSSEVILLFPARVRGGLGPLSTSRHPLGLGDLHAVALLAVSHMTVVPTLAFCTLLLWGTGRFALKSQGWPLLHCLPIPCHLSLREQGQGNAVKGRDSLPEFRKIAPMLSAG